MLFLCDVLCAFYEFQIYIQQVFLWVFIILSLQNCDQHNKNSKKNFKFKNENLDFFKSENNLLQMFKIQISKVIVSNNKKIYT